MTPEQIEQARKFATAAWGPCPLCGGTNWSTPSASVSIKLSETPGRVPSREFPVVIYLPITCGKCQGVQFLDLIGAGIVSRVIP